MDKILHVEVIEQGDAISLTTESGHIARFNAMWLRDNALDEQTRSPDNGQRLITILDVPPDTQIAQASNDEQHLYITFKPENKQVTFELQWLLKFNYDEPKPNLAGWTQAYIETWDKDLSKSIPSADYKSIKHDPDELIKWLTAIQRFGFAKLTGLEAVSGELCKVAELFGHVRETNYGRWFEVRTEINPINLAYTGAGLQAHTDNPYRDPVPTLQLLACLENSAQGGDSLVVDGFRAVAKLQQQSPRSFMVLSGFCARFEYTGADGVHLQSRKPMIELAPDGELIAVRFNNRSMAPLQDVPHERVSEYYSAYRLFAQLIEDEDMQLSFKLKPGELFIVDNTRVMHARKAYSGQGTRWLQGCYADKDGLLSTLSALKFKANANLS